MWRYGKLSEVLTKRIEKKLTVIREKGYADYLLVVDEIVRQAPRTCGRGSAALKSLPLGGFLVRLLSLRCYIPKTMRPEVQEYMRASGKLFGVYEEDSLSRVERDAIVVVRLYVVGVRVGELLQVVVVDQRATS